MRSHDADPHYGRQQKNWSESSRRNVSFVTISNVRLHERLLRSIPDIRIGAFKRGFISEIAKAFGQDWGICALQILEVFKRVPDGWNLVIDNDEVTLTCYEVEVTSPLTEQKLEDYSRLWSAADAYGWEVRLIRVLPSGVEHEQPLCVNYYERLAA